MTTLQIEAGEGVETAINQMKQEKTTLQEKLTGMEGKLQKQAEQHQRAVDDLDRQLQEVRAQLHTTTDLKVKLESQVREDGEMLVAIQKKIAILESDVKAKTEVLLATEAAKNTQKADLENHVQTIQNSLDEKTTELTGTKTQLSQVRLHQFPSQEGGVENVLPLPHLLINSNSPLIN